ncbi:hypothetical protein EV356DRAFT_498299 [Viridothelium virens]|uniref:C2H2-type domain-containing protein n=1 Tax=Viridothelium virens TaxID=1048519 RepID=A0A6A6GRY9_VIRVR|nr:hypothetical protein EV356DRAFT_498299 [Viridothelium virens]
MDPCPEVEAGVTVRYPQMVPGLDLAPADNTVQGSWNLLGSDFGIDPLDDGQCCTDPSALTFGVEPDFLPTFSSTIQTSVSPMAAGRAFSPRIAGSSGPGTTASPPGKERLACSYQGCAKTFGRPADRLRHEGSVHRGEGQVWCTVSSCKRSESAGGKPFSRTDKRNEHFRKVHGGMT